MHRCQRQKVQLRLVQLLMLRHQLVLVAHPVRTVEQDARLQRILRRLLRLLLRLLIHLLEEIATRDVQMHHTAHVMRRQQLSIRLLRALVVPDVEGAVPDPQQQVLRIAVLAFQPKLQQRQRARVVALHYELLQRRLSFRIRRLRRSADLRRFVLFHRSQHSHCLAMVHSEQIYPIGCTASSFRSRRASKSVRCDA